MLDREILSGAEAALCSADRPFTHSSIQVALEESGIDRDELNAWLAASRILGGRSEEGNPLFHLLQLHLAHPEGIVAAGLDRLDAIRERAAKAEAQLPSISDYAYDRSRDLAAEAGNLVAASGSGLLGFLGQQRLEIANGRLGCMGAEIPLVRAIEMAAQEDLGLWRLRENVASGREEFDAAVSRSWPRLSRAALRGLLSLLDARHAGDAKPAAYLDAFPQSHDDLQWLEAVLRELEKRAGLSDGYPGSSPAKDWIDAVARFRCFDRIQLSRLADIGPFAVGDEAAYLSALRSAAAASWDRDRAAGIHLCLVLLLYADTLCWARKLLADEERAYEAARFVEGLEGGKRVLDLYCDVRLLCLGRSRHIDEMDDRSAKAWRWKVAENVLGDNERRLGFIEFCLSRMPHGAFRLLDSLVTDVISRASDGELATQDHELLKRLANEGSAPGNYRAVSLLMDSLLGHMPPPAEDLDGLRPTASGEAASGAGPIVALFERAERVRQRGNWAGSVTFSAEPLDERPYSGSDGFTQDQDVHWPSSLP